MSHLQSLPYTVSTIAEVQRLSCVAPLSLMHTTTAATRVGDFSFPPGSVFMANISHISNDPANVDNPKLFNPDRWISSDGR